MEYNLAPSSSLNCFEIVASSTVSFVSLSLAYTGSGKNHKILEVKPFVLFEVSFMTGSAAYGWVKPRNEKDVRSILKFAFPLTVE